MENRNQQKQKQENEIDLLALFMAMWQEKLPILLTALAGAILFYMVSAFLITPTYNSTTRIYVLNTQNSESITTSDLQSSAQLTKDYKEMFTTRPVLEEVISDLNLTVDWQKLKEKVSVSTVTDGRIISITVNDADPRMAKLVADGIREAGAAQILDVMKVEAVNVVEKANFPETKASPSNSKNALIGFMLGFIAFSAVVVIRFILDDRIKTAEDVEEYLGLSVLGTIPVDEKFSQREGTAAKKQKKKAKSRRRG